MLINICHFGDNTFFGPTPPLRLLNNPQLRIVATHTAQDRYCDK